ncbi:bifunctional diguanylate cyclase/phosphodiesterase [Paenibacillus sp. 481]|nr:bifunctional diguanylate cyclase/phosphodiesterase [Paenibacillus sp. 481]
MCGRMHEHLPIPALFVCQDGQIMGMNAAFREATSYKYDDVQTLAQIIDERHVNEMLVALEKARQGQDVQINIVGLHKQGYRMDWAAAITFMPSGTITDSSPTDSLLYAVFLQDTKLNRHLSERISYMSYYDDMTGLPNRRMFMQGLSGALKMTAYSPFCMAIVMMDLDRFKRINDTFGTDCGDMLLLQTAERLLRSLTENDMLARLEGDEFACYLTNVQSEQEVAERVRRLLTAMEEPFLLNDIPVHVTMSIGITMVEEALHMSDAGTLAKQADIALSRIKSQGKNGFLFYTPDMSDQSLERLTLENDMRIALVRGEFELYYQPQVDMSKQQIVGVEALVRWNHPVRGIISPGLFIPLAEENGFIVALGEWVLEEACRQNKLWQNAGLPPIPVSVNLSVRQFEMKNLAETVEQVLSKTGLEPRYLDLEITESMTLDGIRASHMLTKLNEMGVGISIDDFGTGYSSLHYLKSFPISRLKIDRSFVRDLQQDPNDAAIVSAIIALGHNMKMQVIAEGVETKEQLQFLQDHSCNEIQGYFFSPPLPSLKFESMMRERCA